MNPLTLYEAKPHMLAELLSADCNLFTVDTSTIEYPGLAPTDCVSQRHFMAILHRLNAVTQTDSDETVKSTYGWVQPRRG